MIYNLIITVVTVAARCFQVGWTSLEVHWAYTKSHGNPTWQGWQNHVDKPWAYTKSHIDYHKKRSQSSRHLNKSGDMVLPKNQPQRFGWPHSTSFDWLVVLLFLLASWDDFLVAIGSGDWRLYGTSCCRISSAPTLVSLASSWFIKGSFFLGFPFWRLSRALKCKWPGGLYGFMICFMPKFRSVCIQRCWFVVSIMFDSPSLFIWHSWPHLFLGWVDVPGWNFIASLTCLGGVWRPETDLPDRIAFGPRCRMPYRDFPETNPEPPKISTSWAWKTMFLVESGSVGGGTIFHRVAAQFPLVVPVHLALLNGNSDVQVLTICGRLGTGHPVKTIRCSLQHLGCACARGWPGVLDMLWAGKPVPTYPWARQEPSRCRSGFERYVYHHHFQCNTVTLPFYP